MRCWTHWARDLTVFNPAFPDQQAYGLQGLPFRWRRAAVGVGHVHHPLTPMTDPSLVRVLQRQTPHKVDWSEYATVVATAPRAVRDALDALERDRCPACRPDAITDEHLVSLGRPLRPPQLITGDRHGWLPANRAGRAAEAPVNSTTRPA